MSFFALATILFFASCSKEAMLEPQADSTNQETLLPFPTASNTDTWSGADTRSTTLQISVSRISVEEASGELLLNFSCAYNLTGVTLENTQNLRFEDASGNESTLTFTVISALGSNGQLTAVLAIGGNNLTGLDLKLVQDIIIQDDLIG